MMIIINVKNHCLDLYLSNYCSNNGHWPFSSAVPSTNSSSGNSNVAGGSGHWMVSIFASSSYPIIYTPIHLSSVPHFPRCFFLIVHEFSSSFTISFSFAFLLCFYLCIPLHLSCSSRLPRWTSVFYIVLLLRHLASPLQSCRPTCLFPLQGRPTDRYDVRLCNLNLAERQPLSKGYGSGEPNMGRESFVQSGHCMAAVCTMEWSTPILTEGICCWDD